MYAIPDLAGIALCVVAMALLLAAFELAKHLAAVFNVGIGPYHPFSSIATALNNTLVAWLDDAIKGVEKITAALFNDLTQSLELLAALAILLGAGVVKGLGYLWNVAIPALIHAAVADVRSIASDAKALALAVPGKIASAVGDAEDYALQQANRAEAAAQAFASSKIAAAVAALRGEIGASASVLEAAISSASTATLRLAQDGLNAEARVLEGEIAGAEGVAAAALASSEAVAAAALAGVKSIAITAENDLQTIEGVLGAVGVAGLIASIPALATLVHAIATEAGLDSAECRAKNKQICSVPSNDWANLLGGLAAIGFAFSLAELYAVARPLVDHLAPVIREAA